ncbi:MAG: ABC transporter permease [Chloroflexi bacterium]|nr:ABC transporter permease [Chloroflexota bacterium]
MSQAERAPAGSSNRMTIAATRGSRAASRAVEYLARRLSGLIGLVIVWQLATSLLEIPPYLLPQPIMLVQGLVENWAKLFPALRTLLIEALGGFILGNTTGIVLAFLVNRSPTLKGAFLPIALAIRSIPIVAITPVITLILGFGYATTVTVAGLICFFPTFVNVSRGLQSAHPQALQFFRLLDSSEWNTFWKLRLPSALPFLFAALRVTAPASIIGAMVAEFIASDAGLGFFILLSYSSYRFDLMWQAIILTTACSVAVFTLVAWLERVLISWHHAEQTR